MSGATDGLDAPCLASACEQRDASEVFKTLRAAKFALDRRGEIERHRERIKRTVVDNAEQGFV